MDYFYNQNLMMIYKRKISFIQKEDIVLKCYRKFLKLVVYFQELDLVE